MTARLEAQILVDTYVRSIVDGDFETFKGCLSKNVKGTLQRDDEEATIFNGGAFVKWFKDNHFTPLVKVDQISREIIENNGQFICELKTIQKKVFEVDYLAIERTDTISIMIDEVEGEQKVVEVFHHYRPKIEGRQFDLEKNHDGTVVIRIKD